MIQSERERFFRWLRLLERRILDGTVPMLVLAVSFIVGAAIGMALLWLLFEAT